MTDLLDTLLAHAADDMSSDISVPPAGPILARARRRRALMVTAPAALAPVLAAGLAVALGVGPALVLPGSHHGRTSYADSAPELGRLPMPAAATELLARQGDDPPIPGDADLLAVATTVDGQARLIGFQRRSGLRCVWQDYVVPFLNSNGGTACAPASRDPLGPETLSYAGHADGTPGSIKSAPIAYGSAPPGTRVVEFTAPGRAVVRADARDGGSAYDHRAFYLTSWPLAIATTLRALDGEGRELARREIPGAGPEQAVRECESVRTVLLSHLQRAVLVGEKWARTHPDSADSTRLAFPVGSATSNGQHAIDDAQALERFRLANTQLPRLGPEERSEYRIAAVIILGDGKNCVGTSLAAAARNLLDASASG